jgi:hypothetical protein
MKAHLCFIDLGTATEETRDPTIPISFDNSGLQFG